jgi:hypothetical protein
MTAALTMSHSAWGQANKPESTDLASLSAAQAESDLNACKRAARAVLAGRSKARIQEALAPVSPEHEDSLRDVLRTLDAVFELGKLMLPLVSEEERTSFLKAEKDAEAQVNNQLESMQVLFNGNTGVATLQGRKPIHFVNTPSGWRVDAVKHYRLDELNETMKRAFPISAEVHEQVNRDIKSGVIKPPANIQEIIKQRMAKASVDRTLKDVREAQGPIEPFKGTPDEVACRELIKRVDICMMTNDPVEWRKLLAPAKGEIQDAVEVLLTDIAEEKEFEALLNSSGSRSPGFEKSAANAALEPGAHKSAARARIIFNTFNKDFAEVQPDPGVIMIGRKRLQRVNGQWLVNPNDVLPMSVENVASSRRKIAIRREIVAEIRAGKRPANAEASAEVYRRIRED